MLNMSLDGAAFGWSSAKYEGDGPGHQAKHWMYAVMAESVGESSGPVF